MLNKKSMCLCQSTTPVYDPLEERVVDGLGDHLFILEEVRQEPALPLVRQRLLLLLRRELQRVVLLGAQPSLGQAFFLQVFQGVLEELIFLERGLIFAQAFVVDLGF